ncbi:MAG: hypothetical protein FJX47_03920 [Alphaproteobacteria bacterium]|nr:hypothetical protein [Alphaproteobacteria bacterium]
MQPDSRRYLWDARRAGEAIRAFVEGRDFADYRRNLMLRSAVERQFEIIGEALAQLRRIDQSEPR